MAYCDWVDGPQGRTPSIVFLVLVALVLVALDRRLGRRAR